MKSIQLLKFFKKRPTLDLQLRIKNLNFEIRTHYYSEKRNNIRCTIIPGNSKSLWNAVNSAHDNGTSSLPDYTTLGVSLLGVHERSECFASYFEQKVKKITESTIIDHQVYNGKRKLLAEQAVRCSCSPKK